MNFGPMNHEEAVIFATEELRANIQYDILRSMKAQGLSQAKLAAKMNVSAAWVSQMLSDDANLTVESIAKVYYALGKTCSFGSAVEIDAVGLVEHRHVTVSSQWTIERYEASGKAEFTERRESHTTELLMKVIASRPRATSTIATCNDNGFRRPNKIAEVA
ncbi:helix-turn-helix protein [Rhizobium subbaraonis]|uniref:Helix-turn-helix protein n=1 Tax=Rhizobium subbaraonis TaxID=908946 RepID=A0A285UWL7_9HYPH|nr:helix-turn-helix transcriptional regulator [Rhizobium subbaraonis]SOC46242.1 helix-turn-helix protein [Rhizobium subbaraonis]